MDGRQNQEVDEESEVQTSAPDPPPPSKTVPAFKNCSDTGKQLKKRDLDFCLKRTRFDEKTILFWFRSFRHVLPNLLTWFRSECPNGKLTRVHLLKLFSKVFPSGNAKTFCDHIFRWTKPPLIICRIFDSDGNGSLDFKEFLMALDIAQCKDERQKLEWSFRWRPDQWLLMVIGDGDAWRHFSNHFHKPYCQHILWNNVSWKGKLSDIEMLLVLSYRYATYAFWELPILL